MDRTTYNKLQNYKELQKQDIEHRKLIKKLQIEISELKKITNETNNR